MINLNALLQILGWFLNPKRWSVRRKEKQVKEFKKWENRLAKALKENNTKAISHARYMLSELREKYGISNK